MKRMTTFDYWFYGVLALAFVAHNAFWIGRAVEQEKRLPELLALRDEVAKYKALYKLSNPEAK